MNDDCKKDFYLLISELTKAEIEYEKLEDTYNRYRSAYYNSDDGCDFMMKESKFECDIKKQQIDDLNKQISTLELDNTMKKYYSLYIEKNKLLKEVHEHQTRIKNIGYTFLFGCILDDEEDKKLENERIELEIKKTAANNLILSINVEMSNIYPGVINSNSELKL